jgi:mannose/cellobiose epimerase-like protein (N-acyl-D-glucosamine 2-epimerase family)
VSYVTRSAEWAKLLLLLKECTGGDNEWMLQRARCFFDAAVQYVRETCDV